MRFARVLALTLGCVLAAAGAPRLVGTASAQTSGPDLVAKRHFDEGKELEEKGDFAGALARYKEAEALVATPGVLFHKAFCLEMLGRLSSASDTYDRAFAAARAEKKPQVEAAVVARLEPLKPRIPQMIVRLATKVEGAEVLVDGQPVDRALLDGKAFRVDPGDHEVTARAPGHEPFTKKLRVPESTTSTVDVVLDKTPVAPPGAAPRPTTEPPAEAPRERSIALPLVTTIGAVVLVSGGVAAFVLAGDAQRDAKTECPTKTSCADERSKVRTLDTLALTGFAAGAALGALSIVLWTSGGSRATGAARTRVVASPRAVTLEGTF